MLERELAITRGLYHEIFRSKYQFLSEDLRSAHIFHFFFARPIGLAQKGDPEPEQERSQRFGNAGHLDHIAWVPLSTQPPCFLLEQLKLPSPDRSVGHSL